MKKSLILIALLALIGCGGGGDEDKKESSNSQEVGGNQIVINDNTGTVNINIEETNPTCRAACDNNCDEAPEEERSTCLVNQDECIESTSSCTINVGTDEDEELDLGEDDEESDETDFEF